MVPKDGKLTLEIIVNPDSKIWHWIYETMKDNKARNGVEVCSLANGWKSEENDEMCPICLKEGCEPDCEAFEDGY